MIYKLKVRLPDQRMKKCSTGTHDPERYDAMRRWVQSLKKGRARRIDVLEAIVLRDVPLAAAYDLRHDPDAILGLTGVRNLEPLVAEWHRDKAQSRKGAASADEYLRQVRKLVVAGKPFPVSRFTAAEIKRHLRALTDGTGTKVQEPTRNRHKAAFSSFAEWLVDETILERNIVRDIKGWSEGDGRAESYELAEVRAILERMPDPEYRAMFALAVGAGVEWGVIAGRIEDGERVQLRVRDFDFAAKPPRVYANGGKNKWRKRTCRIIWPFCAEPIQAWLRDRHPDAPAFVRTGTDHNILDAIAAAATAAKLRRLTFHDQRHTHAVNMLREGYRPEVVAHQLGHRDTNLVWERYGDYTVDDRDYMKAGETKQAQSEPTLAVMR